MDKENLKNHIRSFLKGNTSKEGEQAFNSWLNATESELSNSIPKDELEKSLNRIKSKIDFSIQSRTSTAFSFLSLKIAASILLLIGLCYLAFQVNPWKENQSTELRYTTISTQRAQMLKAVLPDSSIVWLNADSEIVFPTVFSDTIREVRLVGEAFFQVKRNTKLPFIVHTSAESTRVLGTSFLVKAYPADSVAVVAVQSGKVSVTSNSESYTNSNKVMLTKNQLVKHSMATDRMATEFVAVEGLIEWREGTIVFVNKSLEEIIPVLERWYDIKIEVNENSLLRKTFNAKFHKVSVQHVLNSLSLSGGFSYQINNKKVTILSH